MEKRKKTIKNEIVEKKLSDEKFWSRLFSAIGQEGLSLMEFCAIENVHYNKVSWRLKSDASLQQEYAHTREMRALKNADKIEQLANRVEKEEIKPDAGRVAIDARKWLASRLDPAQFGDKIQSTVQVIDMNQTYLNELKVLMNSTKQIRTGSEIEHKPK
jgi:hypothetical protein